MTAVAAAGARQSPSLMRRIALRLTLLTALAAILAYAWLEYETFRSFSAMQEDDLRGVAEEIAEALVPDPHGGAPRLQLETAPRDLRYAVRSGDGKRLFGDGGPTAPLPQAFTGDQGGTLYAQDANPEEPLGFTGVLLPRVVAGDTYWVQVERSNDRHFAVLGAITEDFFEDGGWALLPFLLALLAASILTIRTTFAPVGRLSGLAAEIGPNRPDIRLPETDVPREIMPLVRAVNLALERLEEGYRLQKAFTADAAHELRTPLAVLRAQVDLLPPSAQTAALRGTVDLMSRLVSQLLSAARMDALEIAAEDRADLHELAVQVAEHLAPLAVRDGKTLEVLAPAGAIVVRAKSEPLFDALRNLAENALTHSPAGAAVTIAVAPGEVAVIDHGPGIPIDRRSHLFRRFWRAERDKSGAGLGLSIVKRIADAHGAEIAVEDTPGGGTTFRLRFAALPWQAGA